MSLFPPQPPDLLNMQKLELFILNDITEVDIQMRQEVVDAMKKEYAGMSFVASGCFGMFLLRILGTEKEERLKAFAVISQRVAWDRSLHTYPLFYW